MGNNNSNDICDEQLDGSILDKLTIKKLAKDNELYNYILKKLKNHKKYKLNADGSMRLTMKLNLQYKITNLDIPPKEQAKLIDEIASNENLYTNYINLDFCTYSYGTLEISNKLISDT